MATKNTTANLTAVIESKLKTAIENRYAQQLDGMTTTSYADGKIFALTDILYNAYRETMTDTEAYNKATDFAETTQRNAR